MSKCLGVLLLLFLFLPLWGKRLVIFEKPEHKAKYLDAPASVISFSGKSVRQVVQYNNLVHLRYFSEVFLPGNVKGYYSPDFEVRSDGRGVRLLRRFPLFDLCGVLFLCARRGACCRYVSLAAAAFMAKSAVQKKL